MASPETDRRLDVIDVITHYTRAVDTRAWDDLDHVFTADAVLDYSSVDGPVGPLAEVKPWIAQGLAGFDRYQHIIGQVAIEFADSGHASATAYFTNPMVGVAPDGTETVWEVGGYYHHRMARTPDGWRSVHMVDELVWSR